MKPNVLVLSLDGFRYDRISGPLKSSVTPNLDYLIKNGTHFVNSVTCSDSTPMSLASIFTALYPFTSSSTKGRKYRYNQDVPNFLSIFKKSGYHIYGTLPDPYFMHSFSGFFENDDLFYPFQHRLYNGLGEKIIQNIGTLQEPWVYFIHLMDTHKPIMPPVEYKDEKFGKDAYDKLVSFIDSWLGKLLNEIDLSKTIIVITADHGDYIGIIERNGKRISFEMESFGNAFMKTSKFLNIFPKKINFLKYRIASIVKKINTNIRLVKNGIKLSEQEKRLVFRMRSNQHRFLYDDVVRVPLIFCGVGVPQGKIIHKQVRTVDIFPTLSELAGIDIKNHTHGRNLTPNFEGTAITEEPAFLESGSFLVDPKYAVLGIRTSEYKYFRSYDHNRLYLYDLKDDPLEEKNIAKRNDVITTKMEKILTSIVNDKQTGKTIEDEDEDVEEELRKLGYL